MCAGWKINFKPDYKPRKQKLNIKTMHDLVVKGWRMLTVLVSIVAVDEVEN